MRRSSRNSIPVASPPTADRRATSVAGAVLAGGHSRRFGRDKALEPVDGRAMVVRVAAALRAGGASDVVAVGGAADRLADVGLAVWPDDHPGEGPLAGVLTALTHSGATVLVIAACDLPWLDAATVQAVVTAAADEDIDVGVAWTDRAEPLLAAWHVDRCRPIVADAFAAGERAVHVVLERLRSRPVPVDAAVMRNVNRPGDLAR